MLDLILEVRDGFSDYGKEVTWLRGKRAQLTWSELWVRIPVKSMLKSTTGFQMELNNNLMITTHTKIRQQMYRQHTFRP